MVNPKLLREKSIFYIFYGNLELAERGCGIRLNNASHAVPDEPLFSDIQSGGHRAHVTF
jgi:hypothetical protein